jgi:hypothetical protein
MDWLHYADPALAPMRRSSIGSYTAIRDTIHWNHVILTGDYNWRQNRRVEKGGLRPFRPPSSA